VVILGCRKEQGPRISRAELAVRTNITEVVTTDVQETRFQDEQTQAPLAAVERQAKRCLVVVINAAGNRADIYSAERDFGSELVA
jgi:hypothetical protein